MNPLVAAANPSRFQILPRKIRDRIYCYIFHDATVSLYESECPLPGELNVQHARDPHWSFRINNFPINLKAISRQFRDEMEEHLTTRWKTHLCLDVQRLPFVGAQEIFPRQYFQRVTHVSSPPDAALCNKQDIELLPNLCTVELQLDFECKIVDEVIFDSILHDSKQVPIRSSDGYLREALAWQRNTNMLDLATDAYLTQGVTVNIQFDIFLRWEDMYYALSMVHIVLTPDCAAKLTVKSQKFKSPAGWEEVRDRECDRIPVAYEELFSPEKWSREDCSGPSRFDQWEEKWEWARKSYL